MAKLVHIYLVYIVGNFFLGNELVNEFKPMLETSAKGGLEIIDYGNNETGSCT